MALTLKTDPYDSMAHIQVLNRVRNLDFKKFEATVNGDIVKLQSMLMTSYPNLSFSISDDKLIFYGIDSEDNKDKVILHNVSERLKMLYHGIQEYPLWGYPTIISGGFLVDMIWRFFDVNSPKPHNPLGSDIDYFIYGDKLRMSDLKHHPSFEQTSKDYGKVMDFASFYHKLPFSPETGWGYMNVIVTEKQTPMEIVESFDFEHCKPFWSNQDNKLYISEEQLELIKTKQIKVEHKVFNIERLNKYYKRGWRWAKDR